MTLASYLRQMKRDDEALAIYKRLIADHHGYAAAYQQRSELYSQRGELKQALADIDSAIVWDQNNLTYFVQRAELYEKLGESALANQDYETIVKRFNMGLPNQNYDADVYRSIATAEQKLGLSVKANEHFEKAAKMASPKHSKWENDY